MIEGETDGEAVPDAELLRAHIAGDPDAFATLVTRHQDRFWTIALRIMRNPEDAADALQDAYIAAFRRAGSYRGDAQVTTWLHRVVVNACLDRLRAMRLLGRGSGPNPWLCAGHCEEPVRSWPGSSSPTTGEPRQPSPASLPSFASGRWLEDG